MEKVIKYIAFLIFCALWIPIGLFVWIGMLIRLTFSFVSIAIISSIANNGHTPDFKNTFESASSFFVDGFVINYKSLFDENNTRKHSELGWGSFIRQLILTIIFFGFSYILVFFNKSDYLKLLTSIKSYLEKLT